MANGQKIMISAINATGLTARVGLPGLGLVRWQELIGPPNTVAQELNDPAINSTSNNFKRYLFMVIQFWTLCNCFFISLSASGFDSAQPSVYYLLWPPPSTPLRHRSFTYYLLPFTSYLLPQDARPCVSTYYQFPLTTSAFDSAQASVFYLLPLTFYLKTHGRASLPITYYLIPLPTSPQYHPHGPLLHCLGWFLLWNYAHGQWQWGFYLYPTIQSPPLSQNRQ